MHSFTTLTKRTPVIATLLAATMLVGCSSDGGAGPWQPLFNGKDLTHWKTSEFGGHGEPKAEDGLLVLPVGEILTGVVYTKPTPKVNYEVQLEAMRSDGTDFFCGLTFPYKDKHASLIIGGWGGGVCGISSIDGLDASENETTTYQGFEKNKWYKVRLLIREGLFEAWLDGKKIVDAPVKGKMISTRPEVELSIPFGLCAFQTTAKIRNLQLRTVAPPTAEEMKSKDH